MMNANEEYKSRFLLSNRAFPRFCSKRQTETMRWPDDEMTLITNPSRWVWDDVAGGWVDMIVSAVRKCGSDAWFRKFQNNIRPTRAVLNHYPFET
jgi:hypothetical protein